jgi:hypothetical protein
MILFPVWYSGSSGVPAVFSVSVAVFYRWKCEIPFDSPVTVFLYMYGNRSGLMIKKPAADRTLRLYSAVMYRKKEMPCGHLLDS